MPLPPTAKQIPIDVWFAEQDSAAEKALRDLRARSSRNKRRRRTIDKEELARRVEDRVRRLEEDFAEHLAVARGMYRLWSKQSSIFGFELMSGDDVPEWCEAAYRRRYPGRDIDEHCRGEHPLHPVALAPFSDKWTITEQEVRAEMEAELEARRRPTVPRHD